jgi:hypothetical protein
MSLQEYAMRHMLAESAFDRIVVGASTLQEFSHLLQLIGTISTELSPLDAIARANQELESRYTGVKEKA